jgi:hypothetical protein
MRKPAALPGEAPQKTNDNPPGMALTLARLKRCRSAVEPQLSRRSADAFVIQHS